MKKMFFSMKKIDPSYGGTVLLTMAAFFILGAILGSFTASGILSSGSGHFYNGLRDYLSGYTGDYVRPSLLTALFFNFRYHVLIFLISFVGLGVILVPAFVVMRGFFLSLAITGFVRLHGINGACLSFAAFGLQNVFALPVLMILSCHAYLFARAKFDKTYLGGRHVMAALSPERYFSMCGVFSAVLFFCTLIEMFLSPLFIGYIHKFL